VSVIATAEMPCATNVTVTVTVTAELPWGLLAMVCCSATNECKALFHGAGGGGVPSTRLTRLLHKALEHAAGLLHGTAADEINVSRRRSTSFGICLCSCRGNHASAKWLCSLQPCPMIPQTWNVHTYMFTPVCLLQVQQGPACAMRALCVATVLGVPAGGLGDPLWQQPVNAASLVAPSVLDSCFTLMDKLCTTGTGGSRAPQFGRGSATISRAFLVRPLQQKAAISPRHMNYAATVEETPSTYLHAWRTVNDSIMTLAVTVTRRCSCSVHNLVLHCDTVSAHPDSRNANILIISQPTLDTMPTPDQLGWLAG
jgi:hypothetical protein